MFALYKFFPPLKEEFLSRFQNLPHHKGSFHGNIGDIQSVLADLFEVNNFEMGLLGHSMSRISGVRIYCY